MKQFLSRRIFLVIVLLVSQAGLASDIPKRIHQVWVGEEVPSYFNTIRQRFIELNPNWQYNLWLVTDNDIDSGQGEVKRWVTDPSGTKLITYPLRNYFKGERQAIKAIRQLEQDFPQKNRKASISDLMRYRIVHNEGGFYFDMKFELLQPLEGVIQGPQTFIAANEDHLGFEVQRLYLSNAFFAATAGHPALEMLLNNTQHVVDDILSDIPTLFGPAWFGEHVIEWQNSDPTAAETMLILPPESIYPYINWDDTTGAAERGRSEDLCLATDREKLETAGDNSNIISITNHQGQEAYGRFPCDRYPGSIAVDHFDYGSSWY